MIDCSSGPLCTRRSTWHTNADLSVRSLSARSDKNSAAFDQSILVNRKCRTKPSRGKVVNCYSCYGLEYLEVVAQRSNPEDDNCFKRWAPGRRALDLCNGDRVVIAQGKSLSRPFANVCNRVVSSRVRFSLFERSHLGCEKISAVEAHQSSDAGTAPSAFWLKSEHTMMKG